MKYSISRQAMAKTQQRLILVYLFALTAFGTYAQPTAKTVAGEVSGTYNEDQTVAIFKGVPYAAPPVGDLRWKAPQAPASWTGVKACTSFPPSPVQNDPVPFMMWTEEFITPPEPLSEDCLYLNIWQPNDNEKGHPVFVFIHGGGFVSGSGACAVYDGEAFAREGIVFVSINYRLGVFGFMAHPELTRESPHQASGNYALMDQLAALEWVKNNIAAFGGDPGQVTIGGQSAGSFSVQTLVASPLGAGLFHGAVAQSGASFNRLSRNLEEGEQVGIKLSDQLGANLAELRALPANQILETANTMPFGSFAPITDGYVLPEDMAAIFAAHKHNDVPLMAGWVTGDGNLMGPGATSAEVFVQQVKDQYGERAEELLELYPVATPEQFEESKRKLAVIQFTAVGDYRWSRWNRSPSFLYHFSFVPTDKPGFPNYGAFHTSDVPYALRNLAHWDRPWEDRDYTVEAYLSTYLINFIKNGNPNDAQLAVWDPYDNATGTVMEFGEEPMARPGYFQKEFLFMESITK